MSNPRKAPSLEALGYDYWKSRMRAFLLSQGSNIWEITQEATYVIPETRTEPLVIAKYERNNKAVNLLFSALQTAREIWTTLANHHEEIAPVKARLFQAYWHEYENFT